MLKCSQDKKIYFFFRSLVFISFNSLPQLKETSSTDEKKIAFFPTSHSLLLIKRNDLAVFVTADLNQPKRGESARRVPVHWGIRPRRVRERETAKSKLLALTSRVDVSERRKKTTRKQGKKTNFVRKRTPPVLITCAWYGVPNRHSRLFVTVNWVQLLALILRRKAKTYKERRKKEERRELILWSVCGRRLQGGKRRTLIAPISSCLSVFKRHDKGDTQPKRPTARRAVRACLDMRSLLLSHKLQHAHTHTPDSDESPHKLLPFP